jgi:hypothetical protein
VTDEEFDQVAAVLQHGWHGDWSAEKAEVYRLVLSGYDAERVRTVLRELLLAGTHWRPAPSELAQALERDPSEPTWAEACEIIFGTGGVLRASPPRLAAGQTYRTEGERWSARREAILERAATEHPLVAAFVAQRLEQLRLANVDDPDYGTLERRRLGEDWTEFVAINRGRDRAALAAGTRRSELGMHRFDPLKALPKLSDELADIGAGDRRNGGGG